MPIQAVGAGGSDGSAAGGGAMVPPGGAAVSQEQLQQLLSLQAQGLIPSAAPGTPGQAAAGFGPPGFGPSGFGPPGFGPPGMAAPGMAPQGMAPQCMAPQGMAPQGGFPGGGQYTAPDYSQMLQQQALQSLPSGVPAPPMVQGTPGGAAANLGPEAELEFKDFMSAFRDEMTEAKERGEKMQKFVPSCALKTQAPAGGAIAASKHQDIFGASMQEDMRMMLTSDAVGSSGSDTEDFDDWPDEIQLLGISTENPQLASTTSSTSPTASSDTSRTQTSDEDDDQWPMELLS